MQKNIHETGRTSTELIAKSAPHWMCFRAPATLPQAWYELVSSFLLTVLAVIERHPPKQATVRIFDVGDRLKFEVTLLSEQKATTEQSALATIVRNFEFVSMLIYTAERSETNQAKQPEIGQDGARSAQSPDLDDDFTQNVYSECAESESKRSAAKIRVFRWPKEIEADGGGDRGRDSDSAARMRKTIQRLVASGPYRPFRVPPPAWREKVDTLAEQFPNFRDVVDTIVRPHVAMTAMGIMHRMPPVALIGPPGVGKTYFAQALAEALGLDTYKFVSMAAETNGSALAGSSNFWSNSSPGELFETLAWGLKTSQAIANPLVVLDEIDKIQLGRFTPLGALYSLLEVETARLFQDQSLPDVTIDASYVRMIATANDVTLIPEPLLSRLLVVHVELPSRQQLEAVIRSIYTSVIKRLKIEISDELPDSVIEIATAMSPRESKIRLECAIAKAVSEGRNRVTIADWPTLGNLHRYSRRGIGFNAGW